MLAALVLATPTFSGNVAHHAKQEGPARGPARLQPPGLNHIYIVLDAATFAALRDSAQVATTLGRGDGGLPDYAPPAADADRIYFRGRQSYLEFLAAGNGFGEPIGKMGLGLGFDEPERLDALRHAWRRPCGAALAGERVAFERVRPAVPWYDAIWCEATATGPHLAIWAMVYRPAFARWHAARHPGTPVSIARRAVLAGQGVRRPFDIASVVLNVPGPIYARLVRQFTAAGFDVRVTHAGTRLRGEGWDLLLQRTGTVATLRSLTLMVDRVPPATVRLGHVAMIPHAHRLLELRFATQRPGY